MTSSDDSLPVIRRQLVDEIKRNSAEKLKRKRAAVLLDDSSSEESDLPSWLRNDEKPGVPDSLENGEEVDDRAPETQDAEKRGEKPRNENNLATPRSGGRHRAGPAPDKLKGTPMIYLLSSSSDSEDDVPLAARRSVIDMEDLPPTQVDDDGTQTATQPATQLETEQPTQATQLTQVPPTQETTMTAKSSVRKKQKKESNAIKLSPGAASKGDQKSIRVIVPDRLPGSKLVMELETNHAIAGATDLSGDTGAIGRILKREVAAADGESTLDCHELDLKGRIYSVTPVEFPGTIMVLNFSGEEAKVESVMESFVQIREDMRFRSEEHEEKMRAWLEEDDDNEQAGGAAVVGAKGGKGGKGGKATKASKPTKASRPTKASKTTKASKGKASRPAAKKR